MKKQIALAIAIILCLLAGCAYSESNVSSSLQEYKIPGYDVYVSFPSNYLNRYKNMPDNANVMVFPEENLRNWDNMFENDTELVAVSSTLDTRKFYTLYIGEYGLPDMKGSTNSTLESYGSAHINQRHLENGYTDSKCRIIQTDMHTWIENEYINPYSQIKYEILAITDTDGKRITLRLSSEDVFIKEDYDLFTTVLCSITLKGRKQILKSIGSYFGIEQRPVSLNRMGFELPGYLMVFDANTGENDICLEQVKREAQWISGWLPHSDGFALITNHNATKTIRVIWADATGLSSYKYTPTLYIDQNIENMKEYLIANGYNIVSGEYVKINDEGWLHFVGLNGGQENTYVYLCIHDGIQYMLIFNNTDSFSDQDKEDYKHIMDSMVFF